MKKSLSVFVLLMHITAFAQERKQLEHIDFDIWNRIVAPAISDNGKWISYEQKPGFGDQTLMVSDESGNVVINYKRGYNARFNSENSIVAFLIKPPLDSLNRQRRNKLKEDELLKDSLGIYDLSKKELIKFPLVKSYKLPEKWGTHIACQVFTPPAAKDQKKDSTKTENKSKNQKKPKKENDKNGYKLIVRNLQQSKQDTFPFVKEYLFAEEGKKLVFSSTGNDSVFMPGVYLIDLQSGQLKPLCRGKGEYKNLSINKTGTMATFVADRDTTKERIRPYEVFLWQQGNDSARILLNNKSPFLGNHLIISENYKPYFSENSKYLFFGIAPKPILQDTMLLPEEIVNVEVWNYQDKRLYTQQNVELKDDLKKAFHCSYHFETKKLFQINDEQTEIVKFSHKSNQEWVMGLSNMPYKELNSWEGSPNHYDLYKINLNTGRKELIFRNLRISNEHISPNGKYLYWFNALDSSWYVHQNQSGKTIKVMDSRKVMLVDEENDVPNFPNSYGIAAWTKNDSLLLIYDRYDIWLVNPNGTSKLEKLTSGRESTTSFRLLNIYKDEPFIDQYKTQIISIFNETTKEEGFYSLNLKSKSLTKLISDNFKFQGLIKARNADNLIFTKENFQKFPDILCSELTFKNIKQISQANPQQKDYLWGTVELYKWKSLDGYELEGLLYKPENFDPNKKYPMIVNFYEKTSDRLHAYSLPEPHRSTIKYSFYISRGYVVFVPNVVYRNGYPGESAYNCLMPGVTSLIDKGFIDGKKVGIQGHSWGAYQIAYILTKTKLFAAAEAGAPVANMISAYGGIRWETGLSRMFQYEHQQSRIGGTLWEYPLRYIENSPIFNLDKINTPVLLMHNDNDGHVPWYQGIEWFVSMRRLGKPAWMLNYNGEPHWPLKWQNQKDFNIRMQQFFDHFLKGEPMPKWMKDGIPAIEKGINMGYEVVK